TTTLVPTSVLETVTINGVVQSASYGSTTYPLGGYPVSFAQAVSGTGEFDWSLNAKVVLSSGVTQTLSTSGFVDVIDESSSSLGAGWGLQGVNRLVSTSHGMLW